MVETRLALEPEVQEIFACIDNKQNFLLSGGAGSGKTFSLVQVIRQVILEHPNSNVACMTYTNAAVKEIEERVNHNNLQVSTIHDFLWDNIKHFQVELKKTLVALANDPDVAKILIEGVSPVPDQYFDSYKEGIQYKEYLRLREGIISHDELLIVAHYMFAKYPRLCDIVKDKFKFIFVDEYQDTSASVVRIFLEHFRSSTKRNIIGFFGDAMQSIYEDGIGNLDQYKGNDGDEVKEIKKEQNRRNPLKVIELANRLRTDGLTQIPSSDGTAPNMHDGVVKQGEVLFIYSANGNLDNLKNHLTENFGWDFTNGRKTKELNLTHNLIADKAGFRGLMDIYDSDPVLGLKDEIISKIKANKKSNKAEIPITETESFDEIVDKFQPKNRHGQFKKDLLMQDPDKATLYNLLKDKPFSEVRKMYLSKDALLDDKKQEEEDESKKGSKRDNLIKHLFKIQKNITLYSTGRYNDFLRITDYRHNIKTIADKNVLKENIESLVAVGDKTIELIIAEAHDKGICLIDERLERFRREKEYLYNRVKKVRFAEFQKLFEYLEGKTPFSTKHKTKGDEFDDVLVVLDNGGWNKYNFENLFLGNGSASVLHNSQKLFYVCCTRAKEKLAVFYHNPSSGVLTKAQEWFGNANMISI